ncbi:MAG: hypothetical protein WAN35_11195 [Terracidiphilus sp.]
MLDMENRSVAAELIRQYLDCLLTNDEFDDRYPRSKDEAILTFKGILWFSWDDLYSHKLEGKHQLSDKNRAMFERCITFLQTDLEYTGPLAGRSWINMVKSAYRRLVSKEERRVIQGNFDDLWWPFATEDQYLQHCHHADAPESAVK